MLITRVWKDQPGSYFFICTKSRAGRWKDHAFRRSDFRSKVKKFIDENMDKDLYWCPHGFNKPRRLKRYAEMPKLLWADLDEADPRGMKPMPTIAYQSSPGRYVGLWFVDQPIEESLNRRLTYFVGADPGGWDVTQVLRVPGTSNYKYPTTPRVRMLWSDGPLHSIEEIEGVLPEDVKDEPSFGRAHQIYEKYERDLTPFCRRELLNGRPKRGKRSEVLWRLGQELVEAGMSKEEIFVLLSVSPWNKFAKRRDGEKQLRREIDKAVSGKIKDKALQHKEEHTEGKFLTMSMDEVEQEQLTWLWYPYLARGEMTILEGDPGLGKSYLAQMIGACIVDGKKMPCVKKKMPVVSGRVVYFDLENSAGTVTKRRLVDNNCKCLNQYFQEERPFRIDSEDDLDLVYDGLERIRPDMVVFDTINTYIGKADTHKASETQQALAQFLEIAKRFNCAVIVVRHLTKSTKEKALYRGQGSIAFTGMARVVMTVGQHPDEEDTRVVAVTKLNITRRPPALTFSIAALPDTLKFQDRSRFEWGDFVDLSSDEIVSVEHKKQTRTDRRAEMEEFLRDFLADGPITKAAIDRACQARGYGIKTLKDVAASIGVEITSAKGFGKHKKVIWQMSSDSSE